MHHLFSIILKQHRNCRNLCRSARVSDGHVFWSTVWTVASIEQHETAAQQHTCVMDRQTGRRAELL